jgi:hypothetical protein
MPSTNICPKSLPQHSLSTFSPKSMAANQSASPGRFGCELLVSKEDVSAADQRTRAKGLPRLSALRSDLSVFVDFSGFSGSFRSVPMMILPVHRSEPGVRP